MADASVGSITHILHTAFKEVYEEFSKNEELKAQNEPDEVNIKAENLIEYLNSQKLKAKTMEQEEEEELKRRGIVIGQHIPSLPTKLDLNPAILKEFGPLSSKLVIAKELVCQNKDNMLRRTGNLPISDAAELRKKSRRDASYAEDRDTPHYLQGTKLVQNRKDRTRIRFSSTLSTLEATQREKKLLLETIDGNKKPKKRKDVMYAEDRKHEEDILMSMQQKLLYLKNPRTDPRALANTLTRTKYPIVAAPAAKSNDGKGGSIAEPSSAAPPEAAPLFVTEPSRVEFQAYDIGVTYAQTINFRNISAVSRHVRVLHPKLAAFHLSPLKYPSHCLNGAVAPGISVTAVLTFTPDSLGDFNDQLEVETEGGSYTVPIIAHRDPPCLSLPSLLDVGACLVGDASRIAFSCTNTGGLGRFRLIDSALYPDVPAGDMRVRSERSVRILIVFSYLSLMFRSLGRYGLVYNGLHAPAALHCVPRGVRAWSK